MASSRTVLVSCALGWCLALTLPAQSQAILTDLSKR